MSKVYTSAVVIIPPKEIWPPIQDIRQQYDRQINKWMPHITLIYPFRPESEFNTVQYQFFECCKKIIPFEIKLTSINYFKHGHQKYTLWLAPEPKHSIIQLQNIIQIIVPDCNDVNLYKTGFIPHLSVGQIKGKNQLTALLENLRSKWKELAFELNKISFIARDKSKASRFEEIKSIRFQRD